MIKKTIFSPVHSALWIEICLYWGKLYRSKRRSDKMKAP